MIAHTILNEVSHARYEFTFFIPLVVFEVQFFSLKEVLHSPYIGDSRIEGIGVDFGVLSYRGEQVYILIFEPLQELDCSVHSFAPRV